MLEQKKLHHLETIRLSIDGLKISDAPFILDLVNSPGWLRFIGDRNVKTIFDATAYIQRILDNPAIAYWVVRPLSLERCLGIITLIKRDYLEHHDIGFAFHPHHIGKGYAYEAANAILTSLLINRAHERLLATVDAGNHSSIRLLEKLGLKFTREIQTDGSDLLLYSTAALHS